MLIGWCSEEDELECAAFRGMMLALTVPRLVFFIRVMRNVDLGVYFNACLVDHVVGREVWIDLD